ncbi:hypothetical protein [Pararhodobacter aggregans]|nr:hypothetical protein [Pararhodobacter aggregans]
MSSSSGISVRDAREGLHDGPGRDQTDPGYDAIPDPVWARRLSGRYPWLLRTTLGNTPSVDFGPGDPAFARQPTERVSISQRVECRAVIAGTLCDWCGVAA